MSTKTAVVVPWHREEIRDAFLSAWGVESVPDWLILQHDRDREGCAVTKNRGIARAMVRGFDVVVVLDDDCYPCEIASLEHLVEMHLRALEPQRVERFVQVTRPASRGTPYLSRTIEMPVAASMGFWTEVGDYCAVRQLAHESAPMEFERRPIFGSYFPLCGMNLAFRPADWAPWCEFINVARFDDIWMGWLWQREAYRRGFCFNLAGPLVRHSRQSNVWKNLRDETLYLEQTDDLWSRIATHHSNDYDTLRKLLPR